MNIFRKRSNALVETRAATNNKRIFSKAALLVSSLLMMHCGSESKSNEDSIADKCANFDPIYLSQNVCNSDPQSQYCPSQSEFDLIREFANNMREMEKHGSPPAPALLAKIYADLSLYATFCGDAKKAEEYASLAQQYMQKSIDSGENDFASYSDTCRALSSGFVNLGDYDNAKKFAQLALDYAKKTKDEKKIKQTSDFLEAIDCCGL